MKPSEYPLYSARRAIEGELDSIRDALCAGLPSWEATQHALGVREGLERALNAVLTAQRKDQDDDE